MLVEQCSLTVMGNSKSILLCVHCLQVVCGSQKSIEANRSVLRYWPSVTCVRRSSSRCVVPTFCRIASAARCLGFLCCIGRSGLRCCNLFRHYSCQRASLTRILLGFGLGDHDVMCSRHTVHWFIFLNRAVFLLKHRSTFASDSDAVGKVSSTFLLMFPEVSPLIIFRNFCVLRLPC